MPNTKKYGFTLLEVVVVVIVLAILASVAIPRYTRALERSRAAEGTYALGTMLSSIERYYLEHDAWPPAVADLDIDPPTFKHFDPTQTLVSSSCATGAPGTGVCAQVTRNGSGYILAINRSGEIWCTDLLPDPTCQDAGY